MATLAVLSFQNLFVAVELCRLINCSLIERQLECSGSLGIAVKEKNDVHKALEFFQLLLLQKCSFYF